MGIETKILESLMEQSVLGAILVIFVLMFKKFIEKLLKLVENNTEALTKTSDALYQVKDVIKKCEGPRHG